MSRAWPMLPVSLAVAVLLIFIAGPVAGDVSGASATPRYLSLDIYSTRTGQMRNLTVPWSAVASAGGPQFVAARGNLLKNPVVRSRLKALAQRTPPSMNRAMHPGLRAGSRAITGTWNALVVLVDFTDNAPAWYPGAAGPPHFNTMLFDTSGLTMRTYYRENSYNQFDIAGVVNGWNTAPQTYAYYVAGNYGAGSYPNNAQKLTEDLVLQLYNGGAGLDFSPYDNNGDGFIDTLFLVHAGPGAEATGNVNDIWSHQWSTSYDVDVTPGAPGGTLWVRDYCIEPEDGQIGVFCHEFAHLLGAWDLYDYEYDSAGVGFWSLMAAGSWGWDYSHPEQPVHLDPFHKALFGWISPIVLGANAPGALVQPAETTNATAFYKLWKNGAPLTEYFLVENRQQLGFDSLNPAGGLLIYHVDEAKLGLPRINDQEWFPGLRPWNHYAVAVEQADGRWDMEHYLNNGDAGDLWPPAADPDFNHFGMLNSHGYAIGTQVGVNNIRHVGLNMVADMAVTYTPQTWYVQADAPNFLSGTSALTPFNSIQHAIDMSTDGDRIVVMPGVYTEQIIVNSRKLVIESANPTNRGVQERTIIQTAPGSDPNAPVDCVVFIGSGVDNATILRGFTVTHNSRVNGAGIDVFALAAPIIEYNIIRDNVWDVNPGGITGSGIYIGGGSNPVIRHNLLTNNSSDWGGGIFIDNATAQIIRNQFVGNRCNSSGGGIYMQNLTAPVFVIDNVFRQNEARWGGAIFSWGGAYPPPQIIGNEFRGNLARNWGGAVMLQNGSSALIANCSFANCRVVHPTGGGGGAIACQAGSNATIDHVTIAGGSATSGGAIYVDSGSNPSIANSIVAFSGKGGGIWCDHPIAVTYTDFYSNNGGDCIGGMPPPGVGCLFVDPLFANLPGTDLHLKSTIGRWYAPTATWVIDPVSSPCIDAADPVHSFALEPEPNGNRSNMGAYGSTVQASKSPNETLIVASQPLDGSGNVPRRKPLTLTFRWPMNQASVQSLFTLVGPDGLAVPGAFRWTAPFQVMQFLPNDAYPTDTRYVATIASGAQKKAGGTVDWSESVSFRSGAQPVVLSGAPRGPGKPVDTGVVVIFDQPMHRVSCQTAFSITPAVPGTFSWPVLDRMLFRPDAPLAYSTTYTVTVGAGARNIAGTTTGWPHSWTFTTVPPPPTPALVTATAATTPNGLSHISLNLTAAARVQVTVTNIAGRALAFLPERDLPAGTTTVSWNGAALSGSRVPRGQYLVRVDARKADGTQSTCVALLLR